MADCQVDFYVLKTPDLDGRKLACRLALMAWERGHRTQLVTPTDDTAHGLDELLWASPPGRFVPHGVAGTAEAEPAPVRITTAERLQAGDLVINLSQQPIDDPGRFGRLLEIVPHQKAERDASREKFRYYRNQGLDPKTHEIAK